MKKTVARMLALFLLLLPLPTVPSHAAEKKKEAVVLMPLRPTKDIPQDEMTQYEAALVKSLSEKYVVYSGQRVMEKVNAVYKKRSGEAKAGHDCDEAKCLQDIAMAFQTEFVAIANIRKSSGGYSISLTINDVTEDKSVFSEQKSCEGCNEFRVADVLKTIVGGGFPPPPAHAPEGMVFVKGGCFDMGDTFGDGNDNEKPVHRVCVSDFKMDKYEATNAEFERYKPGFKESRNAEYDKGKVSPGDRNPVVMVTWDESKGYCESVGKRLPTEAEWEYAAREGGKKVRFGTGKDTIGAEDANYQASFEDYPPYARKGEWRKKTLPVGSFSPNALGLYDMSGNAWEWVADWYDENYYKQGVEQNPKGPSSSPNGWRVLRGGSWGDGALGLRAASRGADDPADRSYSVGFRCSQY